MNKVRISLRPESTHALVDEFMDNLVETFVDAVHEGVVAPEVVEPLLERIGATILNSFFVSEVQVDG